MASRIMEGEKSHFESKTTADNAGAVDRGHEGS
jgi:hypothetical protein